MTISPHHTYSRIEIRYDGSKRDDQQLQVLLIVRPVLGVVGRVGGLRPQHFRTIA
jgi:hypothetical protein